MVVCPFFFSPKLRRPCHHHQHNTQPHSQRPPPSRRHHRARRPKRQILLAKRDILRKRRVHTLAIDKVQPRQIVGIVEEHVRAVIQVLEPFGRIGKRVITVRGVRVGRTVGRGGVLEPDALYLARVVDGHLRVVGHDIAVGRVGHENEFSLRKGLEDLVEEEFTDREGRRDVAKV